jgi:multiple sugar transport system permease protein
LAGLQSIPQEIYEAAKVDGANKVQQFWWITAPLLKPIAIVILLLAIVGSLNVFDLVKVMTNGGPAYATDVVATYIYRYAFSTELGVPRYGFASAAGVIYGCATMLIALIQGAVIKKSNAERQGHQL